MNEFSDVLKDIRRQTGLSQKDFAGKIGMKPVAYNMVESGKNRPSYDLLNSIIEIFKVDANKLFGKSGESSASDSNRPEISGADKFAIRVEILSEAQFINQAHEYVDRINFLFQRLVDIRALLFQELKINTDLSTPVEIDLLNSLARPFVDAENRFVYPYKNLDNEGKIEYIKKAESCIRLFNNTFFECFQQLYMGLRIPTGKGAAAEFLKNRDQATDHWKYTDYLKSYSL